MSLFPANVTLRQRMQSRLMNLSAVFLLLFSLILTLSPAVRLHSWNVEYRWMHWIGYFVWLISFIVFYRQFIRRLPEVDPYILPIAALLSGWGLLTIWRLDEGFGLRQTLWLAVSLFVLSIFLRIPNFLSTLRRYKYLWLTGGLALTILTFFFGTYPGGDGPRLWLGCCGVYLQPSEPLKLLLIVWLAAYMADRIPTSFNLVALIMPTLVMGGLALVILIGQRDLGTASLFVALYAGIIFIASGRRRLLLGSLLAMVIGAVIGYQLFGIIQLRVNNWLNPWADPGGRSFQVVQSLISVASGGIMGSGIGLGSPGLVPVAHSDFIFSAIAEETGVIGTLGVLLLVAILAQRGLLVALHARNSFQRYLSAGLTVYLAAQSMLIIGGNLGVLPLTGVTLPFVSYGGSSLLTASISIFFLCVVSGNAAEEDPAPLPDIKPYLFTATVILAGIAILGLANNWWGFLQEENLTARPENARPAITSRYVMRGALLDRNNQPLVVTTGSAGNYQRSVLYPDLGSTLGYSNPFYGQAGLEASLDSYLRGSQGVPSLDLWVARTLYTQTPPGLDVRLSLDLNIQKRADALMKGHIGALVLVNAHSGEILALASQPNFDPNLLDQNWSTWSKDTNAPFVNRAVQSRYILGSTLTPFLLAEYGSDAILPMLPMDLSATINNQPWMCSIPVSNQPTWGEAISNGCPGAASALGRVMQLSQIESVYKSLGFNTAPQIDLPVAPALDFSAKEKSESLTIGQEEEASPLQMVLAAAALSNKGIKPSARLASAVHTPYQGWIVLPTTDPSNAFTEVEASTTTRMLEVSDTPLWKVVASAYQPPTRDNKIQKITWFLGGTVAEWNGNPVALALVLEEDDPLAAQNIGLKMLQETIQPTN